MGRGKVARQWESRKALCQGTELALDLRAQTHVLAVVNMCSSIAQSAGLMTDVACGQFEQAARDILQDGVDWLQKRGLSAHGRFALGNPIDEITQCAEHMQAGLVVVGHRAHRLGSLVDRPGEYVVAGPRSLQHPGCRLERGRSE